MKSDRRPRAVGNPARRVQFRKLPGRKIARASEQESEREGKKIKVIRNSSGRQLVIFKLYRMRRKNRDELKFSEEYVLDFSRRRVRKAYFYIK